MKPFKPFKYYVDCLNNEHLTRAVILECAAFCERNKLTGKAWCSSYNDEKRKGNFNCNHYTYRYMEVALGNEDFSCFQPSDDNVSSELVISVDAFFTQLHEMGNHSVKINNEYTAKIGRENIVVGCQTIPFEKVKEIYEAMVRLRE